jgi:hypothetical protein
VLPGLIEDVPMYRASLEVRDPLKSVEALNGNTQVKRRDDRLELIVEDIYEVIQCRYR